MDRQEAVDRAMCYVDNGFLCVEAVLKTLADLKGVESEYIPAIARARSEQGFDGVFLWTVDLLVEAAGLYKSHGFKITEEKIHKLWGLMLNEQRYDLKL